MDERCTLKRCFSHPPPEVFEAARLLDAAVSAHMLGRREIAEQLIRLADMPAIAGWTNSIWGTGGPWSRPRPVNDPLPYLPEFQRAAKRMPGKTELVALLRRDGFRCRFCRMPLVRKETRDHLRGAYPSALRWESNKNIDQHTALQAMWLQYDHIVPHSRGGTSELDNMLVTCAPCNYGRGHLTLEEVGLLDPRSDEVQPSDWDGLERFRP